ncbi:hypothetical protein CHN50_15620 [Priestia aryabhattai]|nr:hypothetical protein CHN50_15620 [Priestia aryabhattai]
MENAYELTTKKLNKKYETFLTFVALSISLRILDFFENSTINNYVGWTSALIFCTVALILISKTNISLKLKQICEHLNLKIFMLYVTYIAFYFIIFLFIFKLN